MMIRTDRRRFPILFAAIAALAVAGAVLASLLSTAEAETETTNFYLWRTTLTVGESSGALGFSSDSTDSFGSINTDADFGFPPWNPPHKHHFAPDYNYTVTGLYLYEELGVTFLEFTINDSTTLENAPGNPTLWIGNTGFPLNEGSGATVSVLFSSLTDHDLTVPDLNWQADDLDTTGVDEADQVRVVFSYERRLPSAPTNVSVTAPEGEKGTLEVSWDEADDGTFPIECYLVEFCHPSGEARDRKQSYPGSLGPGKGCGDSPPTSVTRTDLEPGVEYQVLVQALSGDGYGDWSETKTVRTNGIPTSCVLNPGDLWCGVVTVERGSDFFGYEGEISDPDVGGLSDDDFNFGTNPYTINGITVDSQTTSAPGALNFTFDGSTRPTTADRDKLVLHVGGAAFAFSDPSSVQGGRNFRWSTAGLDWSRKEYVIVRLREATSEEREQRREPDSAPAKPTGLSASATHDSVTLTWEDPQDDSITGYVILRRHRYDDPKGHFDELVADTGSATTTYTDDTVKAETSYTYRIRAINGAGTSERSRWFHIDIPAAPVPDKPTGLSATASHDAITLTWDDPGDDSITGYVILRRLRYDDPKGHFDELVADTGSATTTYTDDTVAAETNYTYRIKAINERGVSERSRWFHIDTPAAPERPDKPTGLTAETVAHDTVTLTWDDPQDDTITGYAVVRWTLGYNSSGIVTIEADTGTADTSYTDEAVQPRSEYLYNIKAINAQGESEKSEPLRVKTPEAPDPALPPARPTGVVSAASSDLVLLSWADPQDSSVTGYRILRRLWAADEPDNFRTLAEDTGSAETAYADDTVATGRVYVYRVLAINPSGVSEPSQDLRVRTAAPVAPLTGARGPRRHHAPEQLRADQRGYPSFNSDDGLPSGVHHRLERAGLQPDKRQTGWLVRERNRGGRGVVVRDQRRHSAARCPDRRADPCHGNVGDREKHFQRPGGHEAEDRHDIFRAHKSSRRF